MLNRIYKGFQALPEQASESTNELWWNILGVEQSTPLGEIENVYRKLAKIHHPDNKGDSKKMIQLNRAISQARQEKN